MKGMSPSSCHDAPSLHETSLILYMIVHGIVKSFDLGFVQLGCIMILMKVFR
jgi:hypothetical protein